MIDQPVTSQFLFANAEEAADKVCFIDAMNGETTFGTAAQLALERATHYQNHGVCFESKVAVYCQSDVDGWIAVFSLWRLGAVAIPLNPNLNNDDLQKLVQVYQPTHWIVDEKVPHFSDPIKLIPAVPSPPLSKKLPSGPLPDRHSQPEKLALILFT